MTGELRMIEQLPAEKGPTGGKRKWLIYLFLLVAVSWGGLEASTRMDEQLDKVIPETRVKTSIFNKRASGYHGFKELCTRLGMSAKPWQTSYRFLLKNKETGTLVIIAPDDPLEDFEVEQLADWVAAGNRLVYFDYFGFKTAGKILKLLRLNTSESRPLTDAEIEPHNKHSTAEHVEKLLLSAGNRIDGGTQLAKDEFGGLIVEVSHGKGKVLVGSTPNMCCNRRVADKESSGNFQFLVNWLGEGKDTVWFDEKCHGYTVTPGLLHHMLKTAVGPACLQLTIIFLVALISLNQRFGRITTVSNARRISNLEFIEGMAQTYRKARANDTAAYIIFHTFKTRLCRALSVSPEEPSEVLAHAWAEATGIPESECQSFLVKADAVTGSKAMNPDEMLKFLSSMDSLAARSRTSLGLTPRRLGA